MRLLSIILTLFLFVQVSAQDTIPEKNIPQLSVSMYGGKVFAHHDIMKPLVNKPYIGNELNIAFQTTGSKYYQQLFNYPVYGFAIYSGHYNKKELGDPFAVFAFLEMPFYRNKKSVLGTRWAFGASFNLNEYDSVANPQNIAIATDLNVYIDFTLQYKYRLTDRMLIGAGIKAQHFSNGAIAHPNLGLNMVSAEVNLTYLPWQKFNGFKRLQPEPVDKKNDVTLMTGVGFRGKGEKYPGISHFNSTVSLSFNRRVSFKRKFGIGIDFFYNEAFKDRYLEKNQTATFDKLVSQSIFVGHEMLVNRFVMAVQLGFYTYQKTKNVLPYYERVAFRYYFVPNSFINVSIKAHNAKADFIEWGIGFTL
jgi:hypothetical protein